MPGSSATTPSLDTFPATTEENLQRRRTNRGFTLVELMVSMAVTLIVLGTALTVFKKSMDAATTVTPAWKSGPTTINPDPEDGVTLVYVDASLDNWKASSTTTISAAGDQVTMPPGTTPAVTDPAYGPKVGDLMLLRNVNGTAVGVVTAPPGGSTVQFSAGDPLQMNGGIAGLANPGSNPAAYPATTVNRLLM